MIAANSEPRVEALADSIKVPHNALIPFGADSSHDSSLFFTAIERNGTTVKREDGEGKIDAIELTVHQRCTIEAVSVCGPGALDRI